MRIKFRSTDPRAGTVAQMDSDRGQQLIDGGAAFQVKDDGSADDATEPLLVLPGPVAGADKPQGAAGKPSDGLTVAELKAALAKREIEIPEGMTLKADLAKLLDDAPAA